MIKTIEMSGVGYLNKSCERCTDGDKLICSEPCKTKGEHEHFCPDCGRQIIIGKQKIENDIR